MSGKGLWINFLTSLAILIILPQLTVANDLLKRLQIRLQVIRSSTSVEYTALDPVPDVTSLIGLEKDQLLSALGKPDKCGDEFVYEFFHLPTDGRGGGPELVISFSERQTVSRAEWRFTQ
jgi:hypothetical protein